MWWFEGYTKIVGNLNVARNSRSSDGIVTEGSWNHLSDFPETSRPYLTPAWPPVQWTPGISFPLGPIGSNVKLTTHLHVVLRLGMSGVVALPSAPRVSSCGDQAQICHFPYSLSLPRAVNSQHRTVCSLFSTRVFRSVSTWWQLPGTCRET
jgi:hypothetical protein